MEDQDFQKRCDASLDELRRKLSALGEVHGFDVEGGSGKLEVLFDDDDSDARFIISPNSVVRQIWISALSTSFKLSWADTADAFVLGKTGETLEQLMNRILTQQLGTPVTLL